MKCRLIIGAFAVVLVTTALPLEGQLPEHLRDYPLIGMRSSGDLVAPYFDGWYDNGDGTVTYSFGFLNRNTEEIVDIPIGENNYVEPAEYNGGQPTHFPFYNLVFTQCAANLRNTIIFHNKNEKTVSVPTAIFRIINPSQDELKLLTQSPRVIFFFAASIRSTFME